MMFIGQFTATGDGYEGRLRTLTIDTRLAIVPALASDAENAPDYRVMVGEGEFIRETGAGWKQRGDKAGGYVAILIEDPGLARPLRANLFRTGENRHVLSWVRPSRRRPQA